MPILMLWMIWKMAVKKTGALTNGTFKGRKEERARVHPEGQRRHHGDAEV